MLCLQITEHSKLSIGQTTVNGVIQLYVFLVFSISIPIEKHILATFSKLQLESSKTHESLVNMLHPLRKMPNQKWIDLGWSWGGK
ncbi:unnamed protein product [Auanema sp. JU1783]|nr:unnamed protein product [Auanema sp. JU1783]